MIEGIIVSKGDDRRGMPTAQHFFALDTEVEAIIAENQELKDAVKRLTQVATGVLVSLVITSVTLVINLVHT